MYSLLGKFLSGVDIRILRPLEVLLQHLHLLGCERGPRPPLLPVEFDPWLGVAVALVGTHHSATGYVTTINSGGKKKNDNEI